MSRLCPGDETLLGAEHGITPHSYSMVRPRSLRRKSLGGCRANLLLVAHLTSPRLVVRLEC